MASFDPIFNLTLNHEGGFQKFANDSANYVNGKLIGTNRGISAIAYYEFYKKTPTEADMKALTKEQAKAIYKTNYWDKINGDKINNQSVAELMFQFIIGSGPSQLSDLKDIANMVSGRKVLASIDKKFTDAEIEIINKLPADKYWNALKQWRHAFFLRLVKAKPAKKEFLKGWQNRLNSYVFIPNSGTSSNSAGILGVITLLAIGYYFKDNIKQLIN